MPEPLASTDPTKAAASTPYSPPPSAPKEKKQPAMDMEYVPAGPAAQTLKSPAAQMTSTDPSVWPQDVLERNAGSGPSFLPQLQEELLQVIKKYVDIDNENVSIELERGPEASMLDINIELPTTPRPSRRLPVLQSAH